MSVVFVLLIMHFPPLVTCLPSITYALFFAPTTSLLEGGRGGPFYEQIVDYFYYCQLRAQGEDTAETRHIRYAKQSESRCACAVF